jgi:hypothetical protein
MTKLGSHNNSFPLEQLAEASYRSMRNATSPTASRRQKKHDMLLTFMVNAKTQKPRPAPVRPKILTTLLSLFI